MDEHITIKLHGPLDVVSGSGRNLTPAGAKAQAIIALLATSRQFRRSRVWLQDQLWSDRGERQASGSLRQALLEIRRAFGSAAPLLLTSRTMVQLNPAKVTVAPHAAATDSEEFGGDGEFLQGLKVHDPVFTAWLGRMRESKRATGAAAQGLDRSEISRPASHSPDNRAPENRLAQSRLPENRPAILVQLDAAGQLDARGVGLFILDLVSRSLTELHDITVVRSEGLGAASQLKAQPRLLVQIQLVDAQAGRTGVRASVEDCSTLRTFWSTFVRIEPSGQPFDSSIQGLAFVQGIVQAVSDVVARQQILCGPSDQYDASVLAASAVRKMFSMRHSELQAATELLDQAIGMSPRGLYHAWRAQLAVIRLIERQSGDAKTLKEQAEADIAKALENEPVNSNVLAAAANARIVFENDYDSGLVLARQSIGANKANPLAWWSLANALLYSSDAPAAYGAAVVAQSLADKTSLKAWADFQRSLTAAVTGRHAEATEFGVSSHAMAPHFRPPLRYLIALYAKSGATIASARSARRLLAVEPDFSVERLISDREYPASLLHRANLIDRAQLEKTLEISP